MDISYLGVGCVKLSGKSVTVLCDPFDDSYGLGAVGSKADVVTYSGSTGLAKVHDGMPIDCPGEYEVKGATVIGVPARLHTDEEQQRGVVYSIRVDGVNVVVTGAISGKLDERQVEELGQVDVLVVPVGGYGLTLDAEAAAEVVTQLEPAYVVPVHFDDGATTYPVPQAAVERFLQEMGSNPEPQSKLRINQKDQPAETQVVVLTRSRS